MTNHRLLALTWSASAMALGAGALATPASAADVAAQATTPDVAVTEIVVTGTRQVGLKAADSPAPVQIVGSDSLKRVGQLNLNDALTQILPSFVAEGEGGDTGNLTLSARLRGVSPNDTLVLINGKRRHTSANLQVDAGAYQGASTTDLSLIPVAAIDHVEVLQDGAAAQYGTDAVAGVINIILKKQSEGGSLTASTGEYYAGDGQSLNLSGNVGVPIGQNGWLNITAEHRDHGFSQRGGAEARLVDPNGVPLASNPASWTAIPGFPDLNKVVGDSQYHLTNAAFDAGYDAGDLHFYAFGTYSHRDATANEQYRPPNTIIASPVLGVAGTYTTPGELIFAPNGFTPQEGLSEDDFGTTVGARTTLSQWDIDLSSTYGRNQDRISTLNSVNQLLYVDTHFSPTSFYDGSFISTQWTNNLDVSRKFDLGLSKPVNLAFGFEHRYETYQIESGDPGSIYKAGGASYPGFQPTDASTHGRTNLAGYVDVAASPITNLQLDAAGRYEHFSDFGDTTVGKLTARYDFTPAIALRGTVSSGFRAPTLAEEYYSATNVSPTTATVQLPANSAAAALLGFQHLKPEESTNYSVGLIVRPLPGLQVTVDGYEIDINNRVVATGTLYGLGGANNSAAVLGAIAAHGNILDPTVSQVGVSVFANGINTRTQGVDLTASYTTNLGRFGRIDWTLAANYNNTAITHMIATPAAIAPQALFNKTAQSYLTDASPKEKVSLGALYTLGPWSANLRETIYGPTDIYSSPNGGTYYKTPIDTTGITDLEVAYKINTHVTLATGANNLFNQRPNSRLLLNPATGQFADSSHIYGAPLAFSPYGIDGGYYYGRITVTF